MKNRMAKVVLPGLALAFGGMLAAGCSSSGSDSATAPEVPNLRGRVTLASPARGVAAPGVEIMLDGAPTGEVTDAEGDFTMDVAPGIHTFGMKGVPGTVGIDVQPDGLMELEVEVQDDGTLFVHEDLNDDGMVNKDDDLNRDGDINDDNDNGDDDGVGDDNGSDDNGADDGPDDNGADDGPDDNGADDGPDDDSNDNG